MSTACGRPHWGGGVRPMWTHLDRGRGVKNGIFCGRHKWMAPNRIRKTSHRLGIESDRCSATKVCKGSKRGIWEGPSIKDVRRDGGGGMVKCRHLRAGEGKDLADVRKMALF